MPEEVHSKAFPGNASQFRAQMTRLHMVSGGCWPSPSDRQLAFCEAHAMKGDTGPAEQAMWEVNSLGPEGKMQGYAVIAAFEGPGGRSTKVSFVDGADPSPAIFDRPPIGPAFIEFAAWVIEEAWPKEEEKRARKRGPKAGTEDRVREAHELVKQGVPKTKACKRVGTDTRTYNLYVENFIDWEAELDNPLLSDD